MSLIAHLPIRRKLTLIVVAASGAALLVGCALLVLSLRWYRDDQRRSLEVTAQLVANAGSAALDFGDASEGKLAIGFLSANPDVMAGAYYREGAVFAAYVRSGATETLPALPPPEGFDAKSLSCVKPVLNPEGKSIGAVYVKTAPEVESRFLWRTAGMLTVIVLLGLVVAVPLLHRFQRLITAPILNLLRTAQEVSANKNYSLRAARFANDEVGQLVDGFNQMLAQIESRDQELEKHREHLEEQVGQRTAALRDVNQELLAAKEKAEAAQRAADAASQAKSQFLASMSHELRTPLNAIIGYSEMLQEEATDLKQPEFIPDLEKIHGAGKHLVGLINDVLDLSKIEAGKRTLYLKTSTWPGWCRKSTPRRNRSSPRTGIDWKWNARPNLGVMHADLTKLRQTLFNLLSNASKFTERGVIRLAVRKNGPPSPRPSPPGEGGTSADSRTPGRASYADSLPAILPLPGGEGRGEGERFHHPPFDDSGAESNPKTWHRVFGSVLGAGLLMVGALTVATMPALAQSNDIPDRPEKLKFPPFEFQPPSAEPYRVPLKGGPVAYVVPDHELPLVNIVLYVRTGDWVEPDSKEGLTDLCGALLARAGAGSRSAQDLEERLAFLAAQLGSRVGGAEGSVSLNLLAKDLEEGLAILREVLTEPRFQQDRIDLQKQQMLQGMQQRNDDSSDIERREADFLAYGEKFWDNRNQTAASVESISREDILAFHKKWFWPSNFVLAVSDPMVQKLEKLFANWPFTGATPPPIPRDIQMASPGTYLVDKDVNQGRVAMLLPGIMRENPDYFPIIIMNDILGGGGFTSRIVNRVRSDEGLAYSAGSTFPGGVYFAYAFRAGFQSKSRTVAYATSIIIEEMKRIMAEPVTTEELDNAKRGYTERLPRSFATKASVANLLAYEEFTGRYAKEPDYWQKIVPRIRAVTREDVQRVAKKYLTLDQLVILVVGQKDEILKGHPDHPVKLTDLAGGRFTELPLRDPLTVMRIYAASRFNSLPVAKSENVWVCRVEAE